MTSTIKVNKTMWSESRIVQQLLLGGPGDTVALASGASQTGFGRTGTVDWQTGSIKTAFYCCKWTRFFADTQVVVQLQQIYQQEAAGAIISFQIIQTFQTNKIQ